MARVVWQTAAIDDIRAIIRYITEFDPAAAQTVGLRLLDLGESLAEFPRRGRPMKGDIREMTSIPPFVLRYMIRGEDVVILSVHHGARNMN